METELPRKRLTVHVCGGFVDTIGRKARRFLRDARAGATAIGAAAVTVMAVGGAALLTDHV